MNAHTTGQTVPKPSASWKRKSAGGQADEVRKKSIASIYKQLARVLHPDLKPDAACRERKVALMQQLTTAYHNNDLHTLLRLELEWIEREEGDLARLTDEKLAIYNQVLKEQAFSLEQELAELPLHPGYQPIVIPQGPFAFTVRSNGPAEARWLDESNASMEATIAGCRRILSIQYAVSSRNIVGSIASNPLFQTAGLSEPAYRRFYSSRTAAWFIARNYKTGGLQTAATKRYRSALQVHRLWILESAQMEQ